MCEFLSWKEVTTPNGEVEILFITANDLFNTKRGRELQKHTTKDDWKGHGAIAFYYEIEARRGRNHECVDFSTPDNFPRKIVEAIKAGLFAGLPLEKFPHGLLSASLDADYRAKRASLDADYRAKRAPLDADYRAKRAPPDADYMAKRASLDADSMAKRASLDADYRAKRAPLDADYNATLAPLDADYGATLASLEERCWQLFLDPANRADAWK